MYGGRLSDWGSGSLGWKRRSRFPLHARLGIFKLPNLLTQNCCEEGIVCESRILLGFTCLSKSIKVQTTSRHLAHGNLSTIATGSLCLVKLKVKLKLKPLLPSVLHSACYHGHLKLVEYLLDRGADSTLLADEKVRLLDYYVSQRVILITYYSAQNLKFC